MLKVIKNRDYFLKSRFFLLSLHKFKIDTVMWLFLLLCGLTIFAIIASNKMNDEQKLVEKAETNWFYHAIAKMVVPSYKGYYPNEGEVEASKKLASEKTEYEKHSVGSYLKMCNELKSILATAGNFHNYKLNFNLGELGTGIAVMVVFVLVVTAGVMLH